VSPEPPPLVLGSGCDEGPKGALMHYLRLRGLKSKKQKKNERTCPAPLCTALHQLHWIIKRAIKTAEDCVEDTIEEERRHSGGIHLYFYFYDVALELGVVFLMTKVPPSAETIAVPSSLRPKRPKDDRLASASAVQL
jgi:hypothetical protein